jgi:hypothetical protein
LQLFHGHVHCQKSQSFHGTLRCLVGLLLVIRTPDFFLLVSQQFQTALWLRLWALWAIIDHNSHEAGDMLLTCKSKGESVRADEGIGEPRKLGKAATNRSMLLWAPNFAASASTTKKHTKIQPFGWA